MSLFIAILGSGPSGLYAADGLTRKLPDAHIDVIERLPTPYGLVRAGVAPDHQGTKAIQRQFDRTLSKDTVRLVGNVCVGTDVTMAELRDLYDAVVIATGAPEDRHLGIQGEQLAGVYGSDQFVGWYNGHPDHQDISPLGASKSVVVIGNGNVALDVCRLLAKTPDEVATSDLCAHAAKAIEGAPITDIWLAGRRGPIDAAFTFAELTELGALSRCRPDVDAALLPDALPEDMDRKVVPMKQKNLEVLQDFADGMEDKPITLHMAFYASPIEILGTDKVDGVRFEKTRLENGKAVGTGETFDVAADTVITAIGYQCAPMEGVPLERGIVTNTDGVVEDGLYVVGWGKRGPSGTIPTNRADSLAVVASIIAALDGVESDKTGAAGLDALLNERGIQTTSLEDWQKIDAAEQARATGDHPREKFTAVADMLNVLS